jgi:hypothetical protein
MEIPMADVINSYRQKLSDVIHQLTMKELHIGELEKKLTEKRQKIVDLQMKVDFYEIAEEQRKQPQDNDPEWEEPTDGSYHDDRD